MIQKNIFGSRTRIYDSFDIFLDAICSNEILYEPMHYGSDQISQLEINDLNNGLAGDISKEDIRMAVSDRSDHQEKSAPYLFPSTPQDIKLYDEDSLSCYKIKPKNQSQPQN